MTAILILTGLVYVGVAVYLIIKYWLPEIRKLEQRDHDHQAAARRFVDRNQ